MVTSQNEFGKLFAFKVKLISSEGPFEVALTLKTVPRKRIYHPRF